MHLAVKVNKTAAAKADKAAATKADKTAATKADKTAAAKADKAAAAKADKAAAVKADKVAAAKADKAAAVKADKAAATKADKAAAAPTATKRAKEAASPTPTKRIKGGESPATSTAALGAVKRQQESASSSPVTSEAKRAKQGERKSKKHATSSGPEADAASQQQLCTVCKQQPAREGDDYCSSACAAANAQSAFAAMFGASPSAIVPKDAKPRTMPKAEGGTAPTQPVSAPAPKQAAVVAAKPALDPVRAVCRRRITEAFAKRAAADEEVAASLGPEQLPKLGRAIEEALFAFFSHRVTSFYKSKVRMVLLNLGDMKNDELWRTVLSGKVSPAQLAYMSQASMASSAVAAARQATVAEAYKQTTRKDEPPPLMISLSKPELMDDDRLRNVYGGGSESEAELDVEAEGKGKGQVEGEGEGEHEEGKQGKGQGEGEGEQKEGKQSKGEQREGEHMERSGASQNQQEGDGKEEKTAGVEQGRHGSMASAGLDSPGIPATGQPREGESAGGQASPTSQPPVKLGQETDGAHHPTHLEGVSPAAATTAATAAAAAAAVQSLEAASRAASEAAAEHVRAMTKAPTVPTLRPIHRSAAAATAAAVEARTQSVVDGPGASGSLDSEPVLWSGTVAFASLADVAMDARRVLGQEVASKLDGMLSSALVIQGRIQPEAVWEYIGKLAYSTTKEVRASPRGRQCPGPIL